MMREGILRPDVSKNSSITEIHGEGVVWIARKKLVEGFLRELRQLRSLLRRRTLQLLRRVSERLVKYRQHFLFLKYYENEEEEEELNKSENGSKKQDEKI